jgi:hypothetical protein
MNFDILHVQKSEKVTAGSRWKKESYFETWCFRLPNNHFPGACAKHSKPLDIRGSTHRCAWKCPTFLFPQPAGRWHANSLARLLLKQWRPVSVHVRRAIDTMTSENGRKRRSTLAALWARIPTTSMERSLHPLVVQVRFILSFGPPCLPFIVFLPTSLVIL